MIGFTLNYLVNNDPASMLYTSGDYDQTTCSSSAAPVLHSFSISAEHIDNKAEIYKDGVLWERWTSPDGTKSWTNRSLDGHLSADKAHRIKIQLYNTNAWDTGGRFILYRDNHSIYDISISGNTFAWSGKVFEIELELKRSTGACVEKSIFEPGDNSFNTNIWYTEKTNKCK